MKLFFVLWMIISPIGILAQNSIGLPQITNYNNAMYKGGRQNWCITQDANGIMYFGNNEGLMSFDGRFWRLYPLPNATLVRSVAIDEAGKIYVGGQDEIGYFFPNHLGELTYKSLTHLVPEGQRSFADVWDIETLGENVFFRTTTKIIHYHRGNMTIDNPQSYWQFLGKVDNAIYAQIAGQGILKYENNVWRPIANDPLLENQVVTSINKHSGDTLLVSTLKSGLFYLHRGKVSRVKISIDASLYEDRASCVKPIGQNRIAIGTISSGLYILSKSGFVLQKYAYEQGLQNNYVRDIFIDRSGNLWLALDYGISYVSINSSIRYINPDKKNPVSSFGVHIFNNMLYLGTSNGLYATPVTVDSSREIRMNQVGFSKIKNTDGQIWGLSEVNGHLLMCHEDGAYDISGNTVKQIYHGTGTWLAKPISRVLPSRDVLAGTYMGLKLLSFQNNQFVEKGGVFNSRESLRFIHYDELGNSVWVSHPIRGVSRLFLSADYSKVLKEQKYSKGLPSDLHQFIFYVRSNILVTSPSGVYEFDRAADKFVESALYAPLKGIPIQYMKEDQYGKVWFITHKKLGVLDFNQPSGSQPYSIIYFPELNGKVLGGFESMYVHEDENVFIGAENGVILLNYKSYREKGIKPDVLIRYVKAIDHNRQEKVVFGGIKTADIERAKVKYTFNSFQFSFTAPLYDQQENIEFSYLLEGLDKKWSSWNNRIEKEYTNLPAGEYTFKVKSRNGIGNESEIDSYTFMVQPPWYANTLSYLIYLTLIGVLIYYLFRMQRKKLRQRHNYELGIQQLQLQKKEKEVIKLRNDKLEADINFKDKELANLTMHLIQRGEVLEKIKENVSEITKSQQEQNGSKINLRHLVRLIKSAEQTNENWEQFSLHFNNANEGFFTRLKLKHPDLTANETKLCALIRMNLLSKEIAQIIHVSVKAVEISRYRLRKKLKLEPEVNLHEYLLQFTKGDLD